MAGPGRSASLFQLPPSLSQGSSSLFPFPQGRGDGPEAGTSGASEAAQASCRLGSPRVLPPPPREIFKKFRNFKRHIVRFSESLLPRNSL